MRILSNKLTCNYLY